MGAGMIGIYRKGGKEAFGGGVRFAAVDLDAGELHQRVEARGPGGAGNRCGGGGERVVQAEAATVQGAQQQQPGRVGPGGHGLGEQAHGAVGVVLGDRHVGAQRERRREAGGAGEEILGDAVGFVQATFTAGGVGAGELGGDRVPGVVGGGGDVCGLGCIVGHAVVSPALLYLIRRWRTIAGAVGSEGQGFALGPPRGSRPSDPPDSGRNSERAAVRPQQTRGRAPGLPAGLLLK